MSVEQIEPEVARMETFADHEVLQLIYDGDRYALNFLINKYKNFVWAKAHTYFVVGGDREDIMQEGMIGLYKAICDYDPDKLASFRGFAELCITRQMITAIKMATRQKHMPLNTYISLDKPVYDEESERTLIDVTEASHTLDPLDLLINREKLSYVEFKLSQVLTGLERKVLELYLEGCTYQEISDQVNRHVKSIDNALQRGKQKLEQLIQSNELRV